MSIVALEINPTRILLVAGRKAPRRPLELTHAIEIPLEEDATDQEISQQLKQAVQDRGLNREEVVVVLSRSQSELREIELPPAPDDELPDMVMFKAKSDFASFNERWLLDFVSLDDDETKPRRVLASAISPDVQQRVESIVEPTGLKLTRMVLRPFAIMDLLHSKSKTANGSAKLVVNPGDNFTDIIVTKGDQAVTTRSIRVLKAHNADQRSQQLLSEVRRTIASSKRQLGETKVEGMILLDQEKSNRQLIGNLGQRLGLDIEVLDPFEKLSRIGQAKEKIESPWQYASLLGSIAHAGTDHAPGIDFLNPTRPKEVQSDNRRWWLYGALAGLAAALVLFFGWWTLSSQSAEIAEMRQSLADQIELNAGGGVRPSVDTTLARTKLIDDWQKANIQWLDEIDQLSQRFLTADEALVSNFSASVRRNVPTVNVTGKIVSNREDRKLFESLEARPFIVTPTKADVIGDADYPYSFGTKLAIDRSGDDWLKAIDEHVREFRKRSAASTTPVSTDQGSDN